MTLNVEGIVDGGVDVEEPLGGSGRLESLHLSLTSSHGLMRILRSIICSLIIDMFGRQANVSKCDRL